MAKIDIFEVRWCDIVFLGRNTSYGAYVLRTESSKRHLRALIIASVLFLLAIASPILIKTLTPKERAVDKRVRETIVVNTKPDEQQQERIELPPPPAEEMLTTVAFPPPKIMEDEKVPEEANFDQKAATESDKTIGTKNQEGTTDNPFEAPVNNGGVDNTVPPPEKVFEFVEVLPQFPGGSEALYEYLSKNVEYPAAAKEMGIKGRVIVQFVVGKDGKIRDIKVAKGVDEMLDEEAVRVVKTMPPWNPGRQGDQTVSVRFTLPVVFTIQD